MHEPNPIPPNRLKGRWLLAGLAALVVTVWFGARAVVPREPVYQGRQISEWMRQIDAGSAQDQQAAQAAIKALGREGAPYLARYLNKQPAVWRRALRRVGNHSPYWLRARITSWWTKSGTWEDSWKSAKALALLGEDAEAALPQLAEALNRNPPSAPYQAVEALAALGFKGLPVLRRGLSNPDPSLQVNICQALGRMGPKATGAGPELAAFLPRGMDPLGAAAAYALGRIGGGTLPQVAPYLESTNTPAKLAALAALGFMERDATNAVPGILKLADDPAPEVRAAVMDALGRIQPRRPEVIEAFGRGLADPSKKVRLTTLQTLVNSPRGVRAHLDKLETLLGDADTNIVRATCRAAGQAGKWSLPLAPALGKLSQTSDPATRAEAQNALEAMGVPK